MATSTSLTKRSAAHHFGATRSAQHYVYRCYDTDGVLLYIGCTNNVTRRISAHRRGHNTAGRWLAACMATYEVAGPYAGREIGREAEAEAIRAERPVFNLQHNRGFKRSRGAASYLIDQGLLALALETACDCWRESREASQFDPWCVAHVEQYARGESELTPYVAEDVTA